MMLAIGGYLHLLTVLALLFCHSRGDYCDGKNLIIFALAENDPEIISKLSEVHAVILASWTNKAVSSWSLVKINNVRSSDWSNLILLYLPPTPVNWQDFMQYICLVSSIHRSVTVCEMDSTLHKNPGKNCPIKSAAEFYATTILDMIVTDAPSSGCYRPALGLNVSYVQDLAGYGDSLKKFCEGCDRLPDKHNDVKLSDLKNGEAIVIQNTTRYSNHSTLQIRCQNSTMKPTHSTVTCENGKWSVDTENMKCRQPDTEPSTDQPSTDYASELKKKTEKAFIAAVVFTAVPLVVLLAGLGYIVVKEGRTRKLKSNSGKIGR